MKMRFILLGISGILSLSVFNSGAQDSAPADSPEPAPSRKKRNDPPLPLTPVLKNDQLLEKLKAAGANLSPPVLEIVKMSDAGADAVVIQAYVENSPVAYHLRAEEVIYLKDHGIPTQVITAMIEHGAKLREQAAVAQASAPAGQSAQPLPPAVTSMDVAQPDPAGYAPSPAYVYPSEPAYYPSYASAYPSYYYPWYPSFGVYLGRPFYYGHSGGSHYGYGRGFAGGHPSGTVHSPTHSSGFHH